MINSTILFPAYGRKYNSRAEAMSDWLAGKDFRLGHMGPYCSCRELDIKGDLLTTYYFYTTKGVQ